MPKPIETGASRLAEAVEARYREGETDYWLSPLVLVDHDQPVGRIKAGDAVIFCCRRGEREVQLTRAFTDPNFREFPRPDLEPLTFVPLTLYHPSLRYLRAAFAPQDIPDTLGEVVSSHGLSQLRIAEEEKYPHITYFLNGGRGDPFPGEVDRRVPSCLVDPPKALQKLVDLTREEVNTLEFSFVAINLATGDIMGHATELEPKVLCAEAVDRALAEILELGQNHGYWLAITADHGLLEDHGPPGGPVNNSHTTNPVPFILLGPRGERPELISQGILADVAPTLLRLLGLPRPAAMTGQVLTKEKTLRAEKVMLLILDGWGLGRGDRVNPIAIARTPCWDELSRGPLARLAASGEAVGLLPGRKGNSEAGHLNLGAGRIVLQDEVRIQQAIETGMFAENPVFRAAIDDARARKGALHLLGILSEQSSHGSVNYVLELLKLARKERLDKVFVHLITDGRSTPPGSAPEMLRKVGMAMAEIGVGSVVTLVGRGFALDRGGDYAGKTQVAFRALVLGEGRPVPLR